MRKSETVDAQATHQEEAEGSTPEVRVSEIFGPTIQGEGPHIGKQTVFVRTGGCDYRCSWCDTLYAVDTAYKDEWVPMRADEIMARVQALSSGLPLLITLSGGNPAIQPMGELLTLGHSQGYTFAMETQGSVVMDWMKHLDFLVVSPKPPSSGMKTRWERVFTCMHLLPRERTALKIVVRDENDYIYARRAAILFPSIPVYLQPCNTSLSGTPDLLGLLTRLSWLVERVQADNWHEVVVLPQLHVLLWGNRRGV